MVTVLTGTGLAAEVAAIRQSSTSMQDFRTGVHRIGIHLAVEASKHLPGRSTTVQTPLAPAEATMVDGDVILLPVLRAGLGLLDAFLQVMPYASVGFAGLRRDEETLEPTEYYRRFPDSTSNTTFIIIDPMLATAGSMIATPSMPKDLPHRSIMAACLIAAPEGVEALTAAHPDVPLFIASLDDHLNEMGFIVPGLGDAGDRLFGTT